MMMMIMMIVQHSTTHMLSNTYTLNHRHCLALTGCRPTGVAHMPKPDAHSLADVEAEQCADPWE